MSCVFLIKIDGVFSNCDGTWCLQDGLTKPQYTRCESITNDGETCVNPEVKYGTSPIGVPREHRSNEYDKWCHQLGGIYENHEVGTRIGQSLYGCSHSDDTTWHWCDWQDSHWHNGTLDHTRMSHSDFITSITCKNLGRYYSI